MTTVLPLARLRSTVFNDNNAHANGKCSSRLEGQINEQQEKIEKKKTEIIQLQAAAQQAAGGDGAKEQAQ